VLIFNACCFKARRRYLIINKYKRTLNQIFKDKYRLVSFISSFLIIIALNLRDCMFIYISLMIKKLLLIRQSVVIINDVVDVSTF